MKGSKKVIDCLNALLTHELSAADQYFIHARMYEDMGLSKLHTRIEHERDEELEHAGLLINRILFLEGHPDVGSRAPLNVGKDVTSMLTNDLEYEYDVVKRLRAAIALCEAEQDFHSREILLKLLNDTEEDHALWLEQQLGLIKMVGIGNYIQSQT